MSSSHGDGILRCLHGFRAVIKVLDGWHTPYGGDACARCSGQQLGLSWRIPDAPLEPAAVPTVEYETCHHPGCLVTLVKGTEHAEPHLCLPPARAEPPQTPPQTADGPS